MLRIVRSPCRTDSRTHGTLKALGDYNHTNTLYVVVCNPEPCKVCSTSTSSASVKHPQSPVLYTLSVDNSSVRCGYNLIKIQCSQTFLGAYFGSARANLRANRYWGTSETLLPVYQDVDKAMAKHSDVDTVVNFASSRSVYSSTMELMEYPQIKSIAIIAEGVPERVSCS